MVRLRLDVFCWCKNSVEIGSKKKKKKPTRPPKRVKKTESDHVCVPLAVMPFT